MSVDPQRGHPFQLAKQRAGLQGQQPARPIEFCGPPCGFQSLSLVNGKPTPTAETSMLHGILGIVMVFLLLTGNTAVAAIIGTFWALKVAHDSRELPEDLAVPTHCRRNPATII